MSADQAVETRRTRRSQTAATIFSHLLSYRGVGSMLRIDRRRMTEHPPYQRPPVTNALPPQLVANCDQLAQNTYERIPRLDGCQSNRSGHIAHPWRESHA